MSLDLSGQNARITSSYIQIHVQGDHPLLKLGNALPWEFLMALVVEDLKATGALMAGYPVDFCLPARRNYNKLTLEFNFKTPTRPPINFPQSFSNT